MPQATWDDFARLDIRVGTILKVQPFPEARKPAYQLWIDFGPIGIKSSSAQITRLYHPETLIGRQVIAVVNFPPKQIAHFKSECLVLGVMAENQEVILLQPDRPVANGLRIG
ncbi:tRNA-binding protein [Thermoflavifilum thermophilum]|uniref:tRNA-binding protein n=1 Tax=Thermoflavifilum thermophilum TaxID=1393122 RepID=UPI001FE81922|nr:tRNA-binding protein [Thermoflavifilum thermophilum]